VISTRTGLDLPSPRGVHRSPFTLAQAEARHRDHAIIEQSNADLAARALAYLPSGHSNANDAWLTRAAIVHNLERFASGLLLSPALHR
jgi:hypothetical protein